MGSMTSRVVLAGFAIFAMLFGSGNIVFPFIFGKDFASNWGIANLGWILAAVVIPMLGYFGSMLFEANTEKYLKPVGKHITALFLLLVMIMVGPFGVSARCVNVSFGGFHIAFPDLPAFVFNTIFCLLTVVLAWNPGRLVQLMGAIFTPLKFGGIAIVVLAAMYFCDSSISLSTTSAKDAFTGGFEMGYQTMDLIAAFIMTMPIYNYIKNALPKEHQENKKLLIKFSGGACAVGGALLAIVYTGLAFVGAEYSAILQGTPDESLFAKIAEVAMGEYAAVFVAIVIAVGCLATNIAVTTIFTDYVHKTILKERFNRSVILVLTGIAILGMSALGFAKICSLMALVLSKLYPALIIFVIARIVYYYAKRPNDA